MIKIHFGKRSLVLFFYLCLLSITSNGQDKTIKYDSQSWLQYFLNARLTEKWSVNFDAGYRRRDEFSNKPLQWLVRGGIGYHLNNDIVVAAGYAYFSLYTETSKATFERTEHRPWLRCSVTQKYGKLQLQHRYRLEWRNIQKNDQFGTVDGYNSYMRAAYQLNLQYILNGDKIRKGSLYLISYDEFFLNFGNEVQNYFDQNRLYFGAGYGLSKTINITLGYQYVFSQQNTTTYNDINSFRFNLVHNLDIRKPKEDLKQ